MNRIILTIVLSVCSFIFCAQAQVKRAAKPSYKKEHRVVHTRKKHRNVYYGVASFYADKFRGRKMASGKKYRHHASSAACNVVPLGSTIRVTNLSNKKSIVVKVTDRLRSRSRRLVDLSKSCAQRLDYIKKGVARVKVEVLRRK